MPDKNTALQVTFYVNNDPFRDNGEATAWHTGFAMADVYIQAPVPEADLYAKVSAGAALARTASYEVRTNFGTIQQKEMQAASFAWSLGAGLRQEFGHFDFNLEVDPVSAKPTS